MDPSNKITSHYSPSQSHGVWNREEDVGLIPIGAASCKVGKEINITCFVPCLCILSRHTAIRLRPYDSPSNTYPHHFQVGDVPYEYIRIQSAHQPQLNQYFIQTNFKQWNNPPQISDGKADQYSPRLLSRFTQRMRRTPSRIHTASLSLY